MVLTHTKNLFLFKNKKRERIRPNETFPVSQFYPDQGWEKKTFFLPSFLPLLLDSELLDDSDHVFWSLYSELSTTTSGSSKWTHLSFFKKCFILKYIFFLSSLYLDLWHPHEWKGKQCFGVYPSVDSPGLLCSCSWTTRLFTYFIFSFLAAICWTQNSNLFFRLCSTGGHVWSFLWPSFLLSLYSVNSVLLLPAASSSLTFLLATLRSYPRAPCVSTSPSIKIAIPTTCWQWNFGQIILPSVYSAAKCRDCPELVVATQGGCYELNCVLTKFTCWSSSPQCVCIWSWRPHKEVIRLKWGHGGGLNSIGLMSLSEEEGTPEIFHSLSLILHAWKKRFARTQWQSTLCEPGGEASAKAKFSGTLILGF